MADFQYSDKLVEFDAFNDEAVLMSGVDTRYPFDYIEANAEVLTYTKDKKYPIPAMMGDAIHTFAPCWQWNGKKVGILVANESDTIQSNEI